MAVCCLRLSLTIILFYVKVYLELSFILLFSFPLELGMNDVSCTIYV